ncbi:MAG: ParB/RepB/Spo0J family partition protein [Fibrobacter sp.]|nr:ParB/RepB/Spo0J family partition protein [Fibrobacter sp.]
MKTQLDMRTIAVAKIIPNQNNPRSEIGDVSDLEASIKAHGLISPLTVRWNGTHFEVVAGSRRLKALQNLGIDKVACNVIDGPEDKLFEIATAENVSRKNMSAGDECRAVLQMVKNGTDIRSIATNFGHSVRWALGRQKMAELGDDIMKMVDEGEITLAHAEVLTMCSNDDEVKKFADQCRYTHPEDLKTRIMNEKKNLSKAPFNTKKICKGCDKQTITQQDIFGDVTDSYCQDGECYQNNLDKFIEGKVAKLKKNGYIQWEVNYDWDFIHSYSFIDPDKMSESDVEVVERIKENGGHLWFYVKKDGEVVFRWKRSEAPEDPEEEEAQEQERAERELNSKVHQRKNELEKADFKERVQNIVDSINSNAIALIFDVLNYDRSDYLSFGECCTVDDDDEYYEGAVANINEATDKGITQRDYIVDSIVDILTDYAGVIYKSEVERAFFDLKERSWYEAEARRQIEEEPETEEEQE